MESGEWRNFLFRNLSGTAGFELVSKEFETGFSVLLGKIKVGGVSNEKDLCNINAKSYRRIFKSK